MNGKRIAKVRSKLRKVYETKKAGFFFSISDELVRPEYAKFLQGLINDKIKSMYNHPAHVKNAVVEVGRQNVDFIRMIHSVKVTFQAPKYIHIR